MKCKTFKECFLIDIRRLYPDMTFFSAFKKSLFDAGALAVVLFRITQYFHDKKILWRLTMPFYRLNQILTGFECNIGAEIAEGLFVPHPQNIVIGQGAVIGKNVTLYNGITLGAKARKICDNKKEESSNRYPALEDNVIIYSGAKIIGPVRIGKNAVVGANSVVLVDVPEGKTAVGVPAVIK